MSGWRVHTAVGDDRTVHVWPDTDSRSHDTEGGVCWCSPWLEEGDIGVVVLHNDGLDRWYAEELRQPLPII